MKLTLKNIGKLEQPQLKLTALQLLLVKIIPGKYGWPCAFFQCLF